MTKLKFTAEQFKITRLSLSQKTFPELARKIAQAIYDTHVASLPKVYGIAQSIDDPSAPLSNLHHFENTHMKRHTHTARLEAMQELDK